MIETTTLSRRNLKFSPTALSAKEFVDMIMQDIETAKKTYFEMTSKDAEARYEREKKDYAKQRNNAISKLISQSFEKYKKEYYRQRWLKKEIAKWPEELKRSYFHNGEHLTFIDWSMEPWNNGTSSVSLTGNSEEGIRKFFENKFKQDYNNKYFSKCTGWEIVCTCRPRVKLILSPELEAQWKEDERKLGEAISRFYRGTNYWGD